MSRFPVDLPPTMLRSTLYTNNFVGNVNVNGNITSVNIFAENIYGNLTSNTWSPGNVTNLTVTGNVTAGYFIGNGALLTGITSTLPTTANIDITGNVSAPGNVDVAGQVTVIGNVVGEYFLGNGALLTGVTSTLPSSANIDIVGNVIASNVFTQKLVVNSASISLGVGAGSNDQSANGVAIGTFAGRNNQSISAIAIGLTAGMDSQSQEAISIGYAAGLSGQGQQAIAIGTGSGGDLQGSGAVAIGISAGQFSQGQNSVAIGYGAGTSTLTANSIAIGTLARANAANGSIVFNASGAFLTAVNDNSLTIDPIRGTSVISAPMMYNTSTKEVTYNTTGNVTADYFIGNGSLLTGLTASGVQNVDIRGNVIGRYANVGQVITSNLTVTSTNMRLGFQAGNSNQSDNTIAIGSNSGARNQLPGGIAIGTEAGSNVQGYYAIAIGANAAPLNQGTQSIAIGANAGYRTQGAQAVAIGFNAGSSLQGISTVAIGEDAGMTSQSTYGTAIGFNAGATSQGSHAVAIGTNAGKSSQGMSGIAIGFNAGDSNQGAESIAIGYDAGGDTPQGPYSVAVGSRSGSTGTFSSALGFASEAFGSNTLALGAYAFANVSNSIILNSTGRTLYPPGDGTLTIAPIRGNAISSPVMLMYNTTTNEVSYNTSGNVSADFFVGNGSLLTGISTTDLPETGSIDISGNVIGAFANVANIIAAEGNVGNIRFLGGNVVVSGQINTLGNVVASNFIGNGSQLAGISSIQNGSSNVAVTSSDGPITMMVGGVANVLVVNTNTFEVGRNLVTYGDVTFPNLANIEANFGNYTPVVVDNSSGTLRKKTIEIPQLAGDNGFCSSGPEGMMFIHKNQLWTTGYGWTTATQIYGYPYSNPLPSPVTIQTTTPITGFSDFWYHNFNAMALTTDGRVFCWGQQYGTTVANFNPIQVSLPAPAARIYGPLLKSNDGGSITTSATFAATLGNGQLYMWGYNNWAQLGRGSAAQASNVIPAIPNGLATANIVKVQIASGYAGMVAALEANGRLWTWGYNPSGACGLGNTVSPITTPGLVPGFTNVTDVKCISAYSGLTGLLADYSTCRILLSNGTSFAAGVNGQGQLADGSTTSRSSFVRENSNRSNIAAIGGFTDGRDSAHYIIQGDGQMLFSGYKPLAGIPTSANATTATTFFYNGDGFNTFGFQRNMLANVGTPIVTPRIRTTASPQTGSTYYRGVVMDNTGNVYATGYNTLANFGNGTTTNITNFQLLNQYFPGTGTTRRANDFILTGYENFHGGTIVTLRDGTMIAAGLNIRGSVPYEITPSSTATPYYTYVPGYEPSSVLY